MTNFDIVANHGHVPVMRDRIAQLLQPAVQLDNAVILDGTLGAGGHAEMMLRQFPTAMLIGVDRDQDSLAQATQRLAEFGDRFCPLYSEFHRFAHALDSIEHPVADAARTYGFAGALFDLGVSSMQLDQPERGFAYRTDAPLDMRMDPSHGITAADILNTYSHGDLARVLKEYGEEKFAGRIASAVVREREKEPFTTSARLVELLYDAIPAPARRSGGHPAKRTFQALRIEVNHELDSVRDSIPAITTALRVGGRVVYMSYQSLEDKIVKREFARLTSSKTPPGLPMDLPGSEPEFRLITRGAEKASDEEIDKNPRAASVRVRAIERVLGGK